MYDQKFKIFIIKNDYQVLCKWKYQTSEHTELFQVWIELVVCSPTMEHVVGSLTKFYDFNESLIIYSLCVLDRSLSHLWMCEGAKYVFSTICPKVTSNNGGWPLIWNIIFISPYHCLYFCNSNRFESLKSPKPCFTSTFGPT